MVSPVPVRDVKVTGQKASAVVKASHWGITRFYPDCQDGRAVKDEHGEEDPSAAEVKHESFLVVATNCSAKER